MLVAMPMMRVGIVPMPMNEGHMLVLVRMRFAGWVIRTMCMLMMLIVHMPVLMLQRFMLMIMFVMFGQMQVHTDAHQCRSDEQ